DVYDALEVVPEVTDRIRHVTHLGVRTRDFAFSVQGLEAPAEEFRVELVAPSGETWTWGPEDATQSVRGSAYDFCLLVTQRAHRDDTDLVAAGDQAEHWLSIAQAFAGPSGKGREASA
ncbi:MAG: wyosine base formation domain-containing protein, partial [Marmoricola sp.]